MHYSTQQKILAALPHVIAMVPIPPFNILAVYVYRVLAGQQSILIDEHSKENINFQLSYQLYFLCFIIFAFGINGLSSFFDISAMDLPPVFAVIGVGAGFIIIGLLLLHGFFVLIFLVAAIVKALMGKPYKFPLTIRFLK